MASVLATISEMLIMGAASLLLPFGLVTAYPFEHNLQAQKETKKGSRSLLQLSRASIVIRVIAKRYI